MSSRPLNERLQKLQQLKKRKHESEKKNRDELFKEHREQSLEKGKLNSIKQKQEKAMEELEKIETKESGEDWERKKGWDYSIEDHEKWDKKQQLKNGNIRNGGFSNYSQLAEQSYTKEINNLDINKEEYLKQKEKLKQKSIKSDEDDEDSNSDTIDQVDFTNKPSKEAIDRLVGNLKESDTRKLRRRKDYGTTDTYSKYKLYFLFVFFDTRYTNKITTVNDKNKQFNEKLNRHYDKHTPS
ncbi:hypothetical protein BN7_1127 [Wickerhamomyces ciferrii]|uniref:Pre-mRNA-splicing factor SYF2 n=1 Tax=Wickerhamomyces ciferrii (strain ATCC 14091 / BCRC 22168 / CBS 111 / JCM 3599 / NBRC 0793 / NRRL Y-1031 F-60-10) TaxID=1206466 RepID=K0KF48_WICCF|nr:uncharacterized protein BN7_1127 [Wickerhamomyces ciferrii]CCH41586.1 hypothetical protein BN7_1127 [Wickerhamomyces ciferrii]